MKSDPNLLAASSLRLLDANNQTSSDATRIASAYLAGYNALQSVLPRGGALNLDDHPLERVVVAAGDRLGLSEKQITTGLTLIAWERQRRLSLSPVPVSVAEAIAWAKALLDAALKKA